MSKVDDISRWLSKQSGEAGADFQITAAMNPKNVDLQKHRSQAEIQKQQSVAADVFTNAAK